MYMLIITKKVTFVLILCSISILSTTFFSSNICEIDVCNCSKPWHTAAVGITGRGPVYIRKNTQNHATQKERFNIRKKNHQQMAVRNLPHTRTHKHIYIHNITHTITKKNDSLRSIFGNKLFSITLPTITSSITFNIFACILGLITGSL